MAASGKLRWGILGVAKINQRLLPAFAKAKHAQLKAIASRDLARAQAAAKSAGIPVAHGNYESLLKDPEIDAVYIPLPNTLHAEWTRHAADHGKHVLCEKPLTPTAPEAADLVAYCERKRVMLMDGFMWPHHPRTSMLRGILDSGELGKVHRVAGAFTFLMEPLDAANIRLQANLAGGSLLDVGCYPAYGMRWAFGEEPARVYAQARYLHDVDIELTALLTFADGRTATWDCGFDQPYRGWLEITCERGSLYVPEMWLPDARAGFFLRREGHKTEERFVEGYDQIQCMIDHFSQAVLHNTPVSPSPYEAIATLRVLDAVARSAREGRVVDLEN